MTVNDDDLSGLRPTVATLEREWPAAERAALLRDVLADERRVRFVARPRPVRRIAVPVAAAAVAALIAGLLVVAMPGDDDGTGGLQPGGEPFTASSITGTPAVGPHQYAFRATTYYETVKGKATIVQRYRDWTDRGGNVTSLRSAGRDQGRPNGCFRFPIDGQASFEAPTKQFVDALPTDPDALRSYLRKRVQGSTSRDEAVFVAVGDMLRAGDLFATSELRAALVEVLSRTGGVTVRRNGVDPRGHPAVRADFVDPNNRPGEISSLYFAPTTFQLTAETSRSDKARPGTYASQGYERAPSAASVPDPLPPPLSMTLLDSETVVDALPAAARTCR